MYHVLFHFSDNSLAEVLWSLQNKKPRDWQNLFAFTRFRFIEVLFHAYILLLLGKQNPSLCRGYRGSLLTMSHYNNTELVIVH